MSTALERLTSRYPKYNFGEPVSGRTERATISRDDISGSPYQIRIIVGEEKVSSQNLKKCK